MSEPHPPKPYFDTLERMVNPHEPDSGQDASVPPPPTAAARADRQRAAEFLYAYRGSPDTFNSYRREVERFLHWCELARAKSLGEIARQDIEAYAEFSRAPPRSWIGTANVARFITAGGRREPNPRWRPYVCRSGDYHPSQAALRGMFSILGSFFNFLVQENYLTANPVSHLRQKSKFLRLRQSHAQVRRLSPLQWDFVIDTATQLAARNPQEHERTLFVMNALYALYLRVSELVETPRWRPVMGHFRQDREGNWWFLTVGKGNKEREVSVSDDMLAALRRYRLSRGLPPLPAPGESAPLIHKTRGRGGIASTRQIRAIVDKCFAAAMDSMRRDGFAEDAERLRAATVHWLRHTGISDDVRHRPREHVRDDAGHGSSAITDRYIDTERAERHASARHKRIRGQA